MIYLVRTRDGKQYRVTCGGMFAGVGAYLFFRDGKQPEYGDTAPSKNPVVAAFSQDVVALMFLEPETALSTQPPVTEDV